MQKIRIILGIGLIALATGKEMSEPAPLDKSVPPPPAIMSADEAAAPFLPSSAAVENNKDTTRRFIWTADLKFRVNSVYKSTVDIEDLTGRHKGFVADTQYINARLSKKNWSPGTKI